MANPSAPLAQRPAMSTENHDPFPTTNGYAHTDATMSKKINGHANEPGTATAPLKPSTDTSAPGSPSSEATTTVEFAGDLDTNHEIPSQKILRSVEDLPLLDGDGKTVPFKTLYSGPNVTRRVLIIFIRHFFCGNCQEFLRTLTDSIHPDELLHLPTPTFIAVVGHGESSLIPMYTSETRCPFPVYADPTKRLYSALGMVRTLNMGTRPEYQRRGTARGMWQSIRQGLTNLKGGRALQGMDWHQVGGEFLFEPINMATPIASPADEVDRQLDDSAGTGYVDEKRITWCHRMKNTRDHAEIPELREVLGLDGTGVAGKDRKRWTKALHQRKGTGFSTRTSVSLTRNGGSSERQSVTVEREKAADVLNGVAGKGEHDLADKETK